MSGNELPVDEVVGTPPVRYTPPSPLGSGVAINGSDLAEIGAMLGAKGMEKSTVMALLHKLQAIAVKISVESTAHILSELDKIHWARINTVMQELQNMPGIEVPVTNPGFFARASGVIGPTVTYVSKDQVLTLLRVAAERSVQTAK